MKKLTVRNRSKPGREIYGNVTRSQILELTNSFSPLHRTYTTPEQLAEALVNHVYRTFRNKDTGMPQCGLVRMFRTCPRRDLPATKRALAGDDEDPDSRVFELVATRGQNLNWNSPANSKAHQVLPLQCGEPVPNSPMITKLIDELGVDVCGLAAGEVRLSARAEDGQLDVFYIENALDSPFIPDQEQFVIPYNIKSVVAFGGLLGPSDLFVSIIFFKVPVTIDMAWEFRPFAQLVNDLFTGLVSMDKKV